MALASGTQFNFTATATTGNVNGAGFNTSNANFLADYTVDSGTGNTDSPVLSSASYSFVAGDVGAWIYVKAGTNWYAGTWVQIASVASNKATLSAAIGAGHVRSTTNPYVYTPTTVAGIASVGTPTGGTCGVDFSLQDTAAATATNFSQSDSSSILISASNPFRASMVGNYYRSTTAGGVGVISWFEIVSYLSTGSVIVDRSQATGDDVESQTGYIGGAGRWNAAEDAFLEVLPAGSVVWVKGGSYTPSGTISVTASAGTPTTPNWIIGYTSVRGDACVGTNRPLFVMGTNGCLFSAETCLANLRFTTANSGGIQISANSTVDNCSVVNTAAAAAYPGWSMSNSAGVKFTECEAVSQNGIGFRATTGIVRLNGCYAHDSDIGVQSTTGVITALKCKVENNRTVGIDSASTGSNLYDNCTFYGIESKAGIGVRFTGASSTGHQITNSIIYGFTTGISCTTQQRIDQEHQNCYYNNTTDVSNWVKDGHVLAVDPGFTGASQITGSTATTSGSVLTQSGGDFSTVTDDVDFVYVVSGTGVTVGRYRISSHTSTTLTVNNALGTSSAGNVVYYIGVGHNLKIGTALKGLGGFNFSNMGIEDRSYLDIGCMQREEEEAVSGGGGGASIVRFV